MSDNTFEVVRATDRDRFVILDRSVIRNTTLSFRARGVLAWILDQPKPRVTRQELARNGTEGEAAMRAVLVELTDAGHITRTTVRAEDGRVTTLTKVYEIPPEAGNVPPVPEAGEPEAGRPEAGNRPPGAGVPRAGVKTSPPAPTARARNEVWDAVCLVTGTDSSKLTVSGASSLGKVVKELKEVGATPDEIKVRARRYVNRYPNISLTPTALTKHWANLGESDRPRERVDALPAHHDMGRAPAFPEHWR